MPERRLHRLLEANRLAVEHLDLPSALRQIIKAGVDMVGVEFGAIGVLGPHGELQEFIHVGVDDDTVAKIGRQPIGLGLLGLLTTDPHVLRLDTMSADPRSMGCPAHHPAMNSLLKVPLKVRDEIFGHLYLADPRVGAFDADDEDLVGALALTAGVAIAHARVFEEGRRRQMWTAATTQITETLLSGDGTDMLQLIAETVLNLAEADLVTVVLCDADHDKGKTLVVNRAAGQAQDCVLGTILPTTTLVGRCIETKRPQLSAWIGQDSQVSVLPAQGLGPAMAVPLMASGEIRGSLFILRDHGRTQFTEFELDVASSLAGHAAVALDRADAQVVLTRAATLEDRDRIARDLHDHVIQRLFAAGMHIQSIASQVRPLSSRDRLSDQVDEIDATIRQIRNTIFGLHRTPGSPQSVRGRIMDAATAATVTLAGPPGMTFRGPLDLVISTGLCDDVVAVVREALTNIGRHASARRVGVTVSASGHCVDVEIVDDGKGISPGTHLSGLANLRERAETGGSFSIEPRPTAGTRLLWSAPIDTSTS